MEMGGEKLARTPTMPMFHEMSQDAMAQGEPYGRGPVAASTSAITPPVTISGCTNTEM